MVVPRDASVCITRELADMHMQHMHTHTHNQHRITDTLTYFGASPLARAPLRVNPVATSGRAGEIRVRALRTAVPLVRTSGARAHEISHRASIEASTKRSAPTFWSTLASGRQRARTRKPRRVAPSERRFRNRDRDWAYQRPRVAYQVAAADRPLFRPPRALSTLEGLDHRPRLLEAAGLGSQQ